MARTKASVGAKVAAGKSNKARCSAPPPSIPSSSGTSEKARNSSGGNPVCPRETPKWQKPITNFFITKPSQDTDSEPEDGDAGSSKSKPRRNVIESDEEEEVTEAKGLDDSSVLEPLNGEQSHKIEEYYTTKNKGKGKSSNKLNGKVDVEKENVDDDEDNVDNKENVNNDDKENVDNKDSGNNVEGYGKRDLEGEVQENASKRIKIS